MRAATTFVPEPQLSEDHDADVLSSSRTTLDADRIAVDLRRPAVD